MEPFEERHAVRDVMVMGGSGEKSADREGRMPQPCSRGALPSPISLRESGRVFIGSDSTHRLALCVRTLRLSDLLPMSNICFTCSETLASSEVKRGFPLRFQRADAASCSRLDAG
jgi:hypothetical protein